MNITKHLLYTGNKNTKCVRCIISFFKYSKKDFYYSHFTTEKDEVWKASIMIADDMLKIYIDKTARPQTGF